MTCRNQPTQPAIASTAPRTVTETSVRRPANSNVKPKAKTSGHAVGAGSAISLAAQELLRSADCISAISSPQRASTYTTVKTTTQTASTKCQYMASTSTRDDCSCPTRFASPNRNTMLSMIRPTITCEACKPTSE